MIFKYTFCFALIKEIRMITINKSDGTIRAIGEPLNDLY